ncbi:MAG: DUF4430 domain-containing protein [Oscillospiraceae bacterium]|nr:DUF4430 domain-containing protein [Oscillospiraceae bacterium]
MTKIKRKIAAGTLALILSTGSFRLLFSVPAAGYDNRIPQLAAEIEETVGGSDCEAWINEILPSQVGLSAPDWYAMALSARGYDLSAYSAALQSHIAVTEIASGSTRERMALTLAACEPAAPAVCEELLRSSAGTLGIMSWIFALHLMNNGIPSDYTRSETAMLLVGQQAPDGGWSLAGDRGDPDVTAMTIQALAPYQQISEIGSAIERGLDYLADVQLSSGAFQSFGAENPESTAQVWAALSTLGIDALSDPRFIADGNTLLDGILQFRLDDGSYAHALGCDRNNLATVQVYWALTAAEMQQNGRNLYLPHGSPEWDAPSDPSPDDTPAQTDAPKQNDAPNDKPKQTFPAGQTVSRTTAAAETNTASTGTTVLSAAAATSGKTSGTAASTVSSVTETSPQSEIIHTTAPPDAPDISGSKYPYRIPMTVGAAVVFSALAIFFIIRKNRSLKTWLTLAGGMAAVTALIWCIRIESPEQFYQTELRSGGGNVLMSIRCDVICGMDGSERFPADGEIMPLTEFSIEENESALTLLYDAVKAFGLQIEVNGVSGETVETAYVRGIASLYEFDFGDLSGWTYEVNGERPPVGCGAYVLHDGDRIDWIYTINL